MTKQDVRARILHVGAEIIHKKGFNNTGIQEILKTAEVPKGSFYFYFKNKDDFGIQLIDYFSNFFFTNFDKCLSDVNYTPTENLRRFFNTFLAFFENNDFCGGCPIGNLSQEMADINDMFRERLQEEFNRIKNKILECLKDGKERNEIPNHLDIEEVADFIINSWEGALIRMKVTKETTSLRIFDKIVFEHLLK